MSKPVVAYYQNSTREQGKSGGIDAQRLRDESQVVRALLARHGAMMKRAKDPGAVDHPTKIEFTYSD